MGVVHYAPPVSRGEMSGIADKIIEAMPKAKTSNEVASDAKFAEAFGKSQKEIDKLWDNGTLNQEKLDEIRKEHLRTPYRQ